MITKFEVENFKNFKDRLSLDFTEVRQYEFNNDCIANNAVNKALVYGHNAVGKSNLGFAMFDIVSHIGDKGFHNDCYKHYINACAPERVVTFKYEFYFETGVVVYEYKKTDVETIVFESLYINDSCYAFIDKEKGTLATFNAKGAETLETDIGESKISIISYLEKNSVLKKNKDNNCFKDFIQFVQGMLFFRSLDVNQYMGYQQGKKFIAEDIIKNNNIDGLQEFLIEAGIDIQVGTIQESGKKTLAFDFGCEKIAFHDIASQGTKALLMFFYWYQYMNGDALNKPSFIYIDEFDAFYHHKLSALIVKKLKEIQAQVILTTHNTSVITNDLLRPDCYFLLTPTGILSLADRTAKDLREANNIEKMYRAGIFNE